MDRDVEGVDGEVHPSPTDYRKSGGASYYKLPSGARGPAENVLYRAWKNTPVSDKFDIFNIFAIIFSHIHVHNLLLITKQ